ncbi:L,D-transpeptidase [Sphingobacterium sp. MYb382]|uniref:L,D-transpeptidase n=1 Tax=Sphingobacterium sp. MYb382 TaxID=2745278 RepID=UPI00309C46E7
MVINLKLFLPSLCLAFLACAQPAEKNKIEVTAQNSADSIALAKKLAEEAKKIIPKTAADITLSKSFLYDQHTLEDSYPYQKKTRVFQMDKIKEKLAWIENFQQEKKNYAVLQNYKNKNREAPLVKSYHRDAYTRISDSLNTERYQSAPLYLLGETKTPTIYGRDGSLVQLLSSDTIDMVRFAGISLDGEWEVPKRYVKTIGDSVTFYKVVIVDVTNQNIMTLERESPGKWLIRSMNPATTGRHNPPYAQETPVGTFVLQEKKSKMFYYGDGTTTIEGYAPYANRFTNGAYIHGVPVNNPQGAIVEYSWSLGTTPRSHMCVRNASSHAKHVYNWTKTFNALFVVID